MKLIHVEVVPHHKVHPLQYATDCEAILGYMLPHDDSVNDRSEGSKLNNAHEITVKLWKDAFSHSFAKPGAMYRGDPPNGKLWPLKQEHLTQMLSSSRFNVRITKLEIRFTFAFITCNSLVIFPHFHCSPIEWSNREEVSVAIFWARYRHGRVESRQKLHAQTWIIGDGEKSLSLDKDILIQDAVDAEVNSVEVDIKTLKKKGILCCAEHKTVAATGVDRLAQGISVPLLTGDAEKATLDLEGSLSVFNEKSKTFTEVMNGVRLGGVISLVKSGEMRDTALGILAGTFYDSVMPETVESMWGPVPMRRLPEGKENKCKAVVHRYALESDFQSDSEVRYIENIVPAL